MCDHVFPVVVRRVIFRLVGSFILATAICPFPTQAHIGISEEIEEITAQLRDDPDAPELYLLRGDLHRLNGHWSEAIADFHMAQKLDRIDAAAELGMGRTWLDQGSYKKALKHLDRALVQEPDNVRALAARAKTFRLLGNPLAAAADYKRAIDTFTDPDNPLPEYYFEAARAFETAGTTYIGAALQTLDAGTGRLGNIRILEDYAIELECKRNNYPAALLRLDRIIAQSARKESLLARRAEILLAAGQPAEAEADFAAALEAIDDLPAQRRHTHVMKKLRSDIDSHMHSLKHPGVSE